MFNRTKLSRAAFIGSFISAGALLLTGPAGAEDANVEVTATVADTCVISSAGLAFGAYEPVVTNASAALNGAGSVDVTCTTGAAGLITLDQGLNPDTGSTAATPLRQMANGASRLAYYLYSDSERTAVWGGTAETDVAHTGTGTETNIAIYGAVTGGQNVPAGSYADTVVATITF